MNTKYSYSTGKSLLLLLSVYVPMMAVFAFTDLDISLHLIRENSFWGGSAEILSEVPTDTIMMLSLATLFVTRKRERKGVSDFLFSVLYIAGTVEYAFFISFFSIKYISTKASLIIGGATCIPLSLLSFSIMKKLSDGRKEEFRRASAIVVLTVLCEEIVVNVLKIVVSRPRMRDMSAPYADFVVWYKTFQSLAGGDSFPSGHTAKAAGVFLLLLIPDIYPGLRKKRYLFAAAGVIWTLYIGIGRIIHSAHFASDVASGAFFMILSFIVVRHIVDSFYLRKENR